MGHNWQAKTVSGLSPRFLLVMTTLMYYNTDLVTEQYLKVNGLERYTKKRFVPLDSAFCTRRILIERII